MSDKPTDAKGGRHSPYFAIFCEMRDIADRASIGDALNAPGAAVIELAKLLLRFDTSIEDEWRAALIGLGGFLIKLQDELDRKVETIEAPHATAKEG